MPVSTTLVAAEYFFDTDPGVGNGTAFTTSQGDSIAIRHMMYLSMSYDHRIIDGSLGATFLTAVARELENFNPDRDF